MCRRPLLLPFLCVGGGGIEWMSCGGEIRAGRPHARTHLSVRFERPSKQLRVDSTSQRRGKALRRQSRKLPRLGKDLWPLHSGMGSGLTADLSMVGSHFYAAAAIACRTRLIHRPAAPRVISDQRCARANEHAESADGGMSNIRESEY